MPTGLSQTVDEHDGTPGKYEGPLRLHVLPTSGKIELARLWNCMACLYRPRQEVTNAVTVFRRRNP